MIQPSKDPWEVPVGPITKLRVKKFKQAFNRLLQDTWAKVDFKRICTNKEHALINLIHIQEGLVGGTKTITQELREELDSDSLTFRYFFGHNWSYNLNFDVIQLAWKLDFYTIYFKLGFRCC